MGSWRRDRGGFNNQEGQGVKSQNRRASFGSWQPTVPSWEKRFCSSAGISWKDLLEGKRYMHVFENVMQWDDSAGKEAFNNAKKRFWAEINRLPCDIALPDPDAYVDEIDWDVQVDTELRLDLEDALLTVPSMKVEEKNGATLDNSLILNRQIACTGWGDEEHEEQKDAVLPSNLEHKESDQCVDEKKNPWEHNYDMNVGCREANGCGNNWNDSWDRNQSEKNLNEWKVSHGVLNVLDGETAGYWCTGNGSGRLRESPSWYMSRYKTKRFHCDEYQLNRGWMKGRGHSRVNYVREQSFQDKRRYL